MQLTVVHYPGWIFLAWQICKLCLKYTLLIVMFPARKNPRFPVSAIWHRDCIDLLMDSTKGITWNTCGCCVNEDSPPCAYSLNFNENEPDNWCQPTVQCKRTKYKGRFSLFLNISNTAQKKVVLKWQKTSTQSFFNLNHNLQTLREFTNGYCVLYDVCRGLHWVIEAKPFRYQRHQNLLHQTMPECRLGFSV